MGLIDTDAVFELFKPFKDALGEEKVKSAYIQTLTLIHNAPSIDIVFCKECKHRYDDGWLEPRWTCDYLKDMRLKDDDFCSYGEK